MQLTAALAVVLFYRVCGALYPLLHSLCPRPTMHCVATLLMCGCSTIFSAVDPLHLLLHDIQAHATAGMAPCNIVHV